MSDLEDNSDTEQEADIEPDVEIESDKEEKDTDITKPIASKKLTPEFNESEDDTALEDTDDEEIAIEEQENNDTQDYPFEYTQSDEPVENTVTLSPINSEIDSDDDEYLQKFEPNYNNEYIKRVHPECLTSNAVEIEALTVITRDKNNIIIDENHQTNPFLSKYERTRILGQRVKQINAGHKLYVKVPPGIIDGYLIAEIELREKKIPVIVRRPLPGGKSEYWKLEDLEQIN